LRCTSAWGDGLWIVVECLAISILEGRQFKEASRLAGESKAMAQRVEKEQENLRAAEEAMAIASQNLALLSDEVSLLREESSQLERKEGQLCLSWPTHPHQINHALMQMKFTSKICSKPIIPSAIYMKC
jgi:hypothetical protein